MSDTATKSAVNKGANSEDLLSSDAGLILNGVVTTKPEPESFTSKTGKMFYSMKFSVSDGVNTFPCKISSETGEDYPSLALFRPASFRVLEARHDSYNGIAYYVEQN